MQLLEKLYTKQFHLNKILGPTVGAKSKDSREFIEIACYSGPSTSSVEANIKNLTKMLLVMYILVDI